MFKKWLNASATLLVSVLAVCAQGTVDKARVQYPTEEEIARQQDLLRHPTFITLRLISVGRYVPREAPTDTPAPYKVNDPIRFDLFITQNSTEKITMWVPAASCYQCRPELMKDGEIIPYSKTRQNQIDSDESGRSLSNSSGSIITFEPGREFGPQSIDLDSWYDPPTPGRYQLTARKQFVRGGDWVVSNSVYFEVIPRRPGSPIPPGVTIELTPEGVQPKADGKPYQLGNEVFVTFLVRNKSDQPLKINVIDRDYSNRPELFKDGKLVPYLEQADALIKAKEENPRLVEENDFFLDPRTGAWPDGIDLKKWYGPLSPGSYRLVIRHRFEIDGPWSAESSPLLFEVVASKHN
jgi:hypothetical protein